MAIPVRDLIEEGGTLPTFCWPGGYDVVYYARDGFTYCGRCADAVYRDPEFDAAEKPAVGESMDGHDSCESCDHCGAVVAAIGCSGEGHSEFCDLCPSGR